MNDVTVKYGDGSPKPLGTWDFYGAWAPRNSGYFSSITFTLGVFQWVAARRGVKRGKVVRRVKGYTGNPEEAYAKAVKIVEDLNQAVK